MDNGSNATKAERFAEFLRRLERLTDGLRPR